MEVRIGDRTAEVELISKEDNKVKISIDGNIYDVDIVMAENGLCSIITNDGKSYNTEIKRPNKDKEYTVNVLFDSYQVEMIDLHTKYLRSRKNAESGGVQDRIFSPMPGMPGILSEVSPISAFICRYPKGSTPYFSTTSGT